MSGSIILLLRATIKAHLVLYKSKPVHSESVPNVFVSHAPVSQNIKRVTRLSRTGLWVERHPSTSCTFCASSLLSFCLFLLWQLNEVKFLHCCVAPHSVYALILLMVSVITGQTYCLLSLWSYKSLNPYMKRHLVLVPVELRKNCFDAVNIRYHLADRVQSGDLAIEKSTKCWVSFPATQKYTHWPLF